jgi:hypothetical protein
MAGDDIAKVAVQSKGYHHRCCLGWATACETVMGLLAWLRRLRI